MITLNVSASNTVSPIARVPTGIRRAAPQRVTQVAITGTATVTIEGRLDPAAAWQALYSTTTSAATLIALLPEMRATASSAAEGAQATVYIDAENA